MWGTGGNNDEQVISRVLGGELDQFGVLVRRYLPIVEAIARAQLGGGHQVEDVAQEAFLQAYLRLDQLRERSKFGPWIATITRNVATRLGVRESRMRETAAAWLPQAEVPNTPQDLVRAELREAVQKELDGLAPEDRELLMLRYYVGKNSREIAELAGLTDVAVRKRLERARAVLGERLLILLEADTLRQEAPSPRERAILAAVLSSSAAWVNSEAAAATGTATSTAAAGVFAAAVGAGAIKVIVGIVALGIAALGGFLLLPLPEQDPPSDTGTEASGVVAQASGAAVTAATSAAETETAVPAPATGRGAAEEPQATPGIAVRGQVVQTDGAPVSGANVTAAIWGEGKKTRATGASDASGNFELRLPEPAEALLVWAEKEGYVRKKQDQHRLTNAGLESVKVELYHEAAIEGQVVNERGDGVPDLPVTVRNISIENVLETMMATSGPRGEFRIARLLPGKHSVAIVKEEQWSDALELLQVGVAEGETVKDVRVPYTGSGILLEGRVTGTERKPLKGAFVQILAGFNPRNAYTDDDGRYRLDQLPDEEFSMHVTADGHQGEGRQMKPGESGDFELRPLGSVSGVVMDAAKNQPLTKFEVYAVEGRTATVGLAQERWFKKIEDEQGRFTLDKVNLDQATVIARAEGYAPAFEVVELAAGERQEGLKLALERGATLEGKVVTKEGRPVAEAYVYMGPRMFLPEGVEKQFVATQTAEVAKATTNAEGKFAITGLAAGTQSVSAFHPTLGTGTASAELAEDGRADAVEIVLSNGGSVHGKIALDGQPLPKAHLMATAPGGLGMPYAQGQSGEDGSYTLREIPAGPVTILAIVPAGESTQSMRRIMREAVVQEGKSVEVHFDVASGTGTVVGTLLLPDSLDVKGGQIQVQSGQGDTRDERMVQFSGGESFTLTEMPAGPATISVNLMTTVGTAGFSARSRTVVAEVRPDETVEVELDFMEQASLLGTVSGIAPGERGTVMVLEGQVAVESFSLEFLASAAASARGSATVGTDGTYLVEGLPAGTFTVVAAAMASDGPDMAEKARFDTAVVTLEADQAEDLSFVLE